MKVLLTGASGFIGSALCAALRQRGDTPVVLSRGSPGPLRWGPAVGHIDANAFSDADAVVHLAGRRIQPPFTARLRKEILDSRVDGTHLVAAAVARHRPTVFISGSAIGFYGDRGDEELTESSTAGTGFLADVVQAWEEAARPTTEAGVRTVLLRTGLVLDRSGGLLPAMSLPIRLGLAGPMGGGQQWWSWISLEDEVRAILHCMDTELSGPVNLTAPGSVTNAEFFKILARKLRRPAVIPLPAFALRLALGRFAADDLILASQRVSPRALLESGFKFTHPDLAALPT